MAIYNYTYRHIRYERFEYLIKWFCNTYQLRDWDIQLEIGTETPKDFEDSSQDSPGGCSIQSFNLIAKIWINTQECKTSNINPLEVLVHELLHILVDASQIETDFDDLLIFKIQRTILEKYAVECGIVI